ncbi:MAG: tetratricopeptide repeat protein [Planctomycetota bacterium]
MTHTDPASVSPANDRVRETVWLAVLFLAGLGVRLIYVWQSRANPLFEYPTLDAELHVRWAKAIAAGETLFPGPYFRAPLYPWFLAGIYWIAGPGALLPRLVQCVLGSVSCVLIYLLGREAFGRVTGLLAGFAAATYWVFVYYEGELLLESLSIFLNLLALWFILQAARKPGVVYWCLAGVLLGLSAINRPNVVAFMPLAALWIVLLHRKEWKRGLGCAAWFGLACAVPILPLTVRNYVVGKDFVLIAWQGGPNFYIGNNPQSDGMNTVMPGARRDWWGAYSDWIALAEEEAGRKLKPSEVSRHYSRKVWRFFREQPRRAAGLMKLKLLYFLNGTEIPNPTNLYYFTRRYTPIIRFLPLGFGMLVPFAVLGVWFSRRQFVPHFPLWGFGLVYMGTVVAFYVNSRFRLPVVPVVMVYAGYALVHLARAARSRDWRCLAGSGLTLAVLWPFVNTGVPASYLNAATSPCFVGEALIEAGRPDEALQEFQSALATLPENARAYAGLGVVHLTRGDFEEAIRALKRALELDPVMPIHDRLAEVYVRAGRSPEAVKTLRAGMAATPGHWELARELAWVLATCPQSEVRNGQEAVKLAEQALRLGGAQVATLDTLAAACAEVGRFDEAIEMAQGALELARQRGTAATAEAISARLSQYRRGQAYREAGPLSGPL